MNRNGSKPKKVLTIKCHYCNKDFQRNESVYNRNIRQNKKSFCSGTCVAQWKKEHGLGNKAKYPKIIELKCANCGKLFDREDDYDKRKRRRKGVQPCCSAHCITDYARKCCKTKGRSKLEEWLEAKLKELYPLLPILYNNRDVVGLELDIYIPSLELAFELNGICHYKPIYGINVFTKATFRDILKEHKCKVKHIDLYIIDCRDIIHFREKDGKKYLEEITKRIYEKSKEKTNIKNNT